MTDQQNQSLRFLQTNLSHLRTLTSILNYYVENTSVVFHINPLSLKEAEENFLQQHSKYKTFTIFINETIIGYIQLCQHKKRDAYNSTAEVSIYLDLNFTGMGIGAKAIEYIEKYAKRAEFHTLIATISGENTASIKVFEKSGYKKCAHYKEVGIKFNRYLDVVAYQKILLNSNP